MPYKKGDEKIYFPVVIGSLVALAAIIGTIFYQGLQVEQEDFEEILDEETASFESTIPQPTEPPSFVPPTSPPPITN